MFEGSRRRRRFPVVRLALAIAVIALLIFAWQRGGEKPLVAVEKAIPAERLGR